MKHLAITALILLAAFSAAMAGDADIVTLSDKATVSGEHVLLGDVASIQGPHARELGAAQLVKAPRTVLGITLSSQFVASRIRDRQPDWQVTLAGAPRVTVSARMARIPGSELEALYRDAVKKESPWKDKGSIVITDIRMPDSLSVPEKDKGRLQANFSRGEDFMGLVTATISSGSDPANLCRVSGKIQVMADVPVTRNAISRGAIISANDLEMRSYDISSSPVLVTDLAQCLGKRAKTTLHAGRPVLRTNIEQPPLVSRGDLIAIQASSGDLVVMDKGVALKDGSQGEKIPVKNVGSGKQVVGTIIAHSLVEVTF